MDVEIKNNAPSHHRLIVGDKEIFGGEKAYVSEEVALDLATAPYIDIEILSEGFEVPDAAAEPERTLEDLSRTELNQRAIDAGVDQPEQLPNKGEVIASIEDAIAEPENEPEAESGEGQEPEEEE